LHKLRDDEGCDLRIDLSRVQSYFLFKTPHYVVTCG
jgi:hypothetical protein